MGGGGGGGSGYTGGCAVGKIVGESGSFFSYLVESFLSFLLSLSL